MNILERIPEIVCPLCKGDLEENAGLQCMKCGKGYEIVNGIPYLINDDLKDFAEEIAVQDRVALEYEQKRYRNPFAKRYHDWWIEQMLSYIQPAGRVLDDGCGVGLLAKKLANDRVVGIDISSEMLRHASANSNRLILGNSQELPLRDKSFDIVFCRSLLHHLPVPELAISEIHRILRPGGEAVFADTNASLLSTLPRIFAKRGKHFSSEHKNLNPRIFKKMLKQDFKIEKIIYFGYLAYPLLGFPDMLRIFRFVPFKSIVEPSLMFIDKILSKIPIIRTQSWGIIVKARKP